MHRATIHVRLLAILVVAGLAAFTAAPSRPVQAQAPGDEGPQLPIPPNFDPGKAGKKKKKVTDPEKAAKLDQIFTWVENTIGPQLGMDNPRQEWTDMSVNADADGSWHFRLTQVFQGVPVRGGALSINMRTAEQQQGMADPDWHGEYMDDPQVDTKPKLSAQQAIRMAEGEMEKFKKAKKAKKGRTDQAGAVAPKSNLKKQPKAWLEILPGQGKGKRELSYHVVVESDDIVEDDAGPRPIQLHVWVGAGANNQGKTLDSYNNIQTFWAQETHTGRSLYSGSEPVGVVADYQIVSFFPLTFGRVQGYLEDTVYGFGTFDCFSTGTAFRTTNGASSIWGNFSTSNRHSENVDGHRNSLKTSSFIYWILGRNFVDGAFGPRPYFAVDGSTVAGTRTHYGVSYANAFWDGVQVTLGSGNTSINPNGAGSWGPLNSLDIVGHEWTHGLVQYTAGLIYMDESGALNEHYADVMGAMTERYWFGESSNTWLIGERPRTPSIAGDALRYFIRPTLDGSSRDHYALRYVGPADNGGVHWNSGIGNNAFYMLSRGGTHRLGGTIPSAPFGIGPDKATQIWWRALDLYLIPNDNYFWMRRCTQWAAEDLYGFGSTEHLATIQAWNAVGAP